jgi:hypothetical protein
MSKSRKFYSAINGLLWCVCSTLEYLRSHSTLEMPLPISDKAWYRQMNKLAMWASDEHADVMSKLPLKREELLKLEDADDNLLFAWSSTLENGAQAMHSIAPEVDAGILLYRAYLCWLNQCLDIYDDLMHRDTMKQSVYYKRYTENRDMFDHVRHLIKIEQKELERFDSQVSPNSISRVQEDLSLLCDEISTNWRTSVIQRTDQLTTRE